MIPNENIYNGLGLFMLVALFFLGLMMGFLIYKVVFMIFVENKHKTDLNNIEDETNGR